MQESTFSNYDVSQVVGKNSSKPEHSSQVCWKAIFSGIIAATGVSLLFILLGLGLGLSPNIPWSLEAIAVAGTSALIWVALIQFVASALGGYLSGYLRPRSGEGKQQCTPSFSDACQGIVTWSASTLVTAILLLWIGSLITGGLFGAGKAATDGMGPDAIGKISTYAPNSSENSVAYFSDILLRGDQSSSDKETNISRGEITRILITNLANSEINSADREYLTKIVGKSQRITQAEAGKVVDEVFGRLRKTSSDTKEQSKRALEKSKNAISHAALWMSLALLLGLLIASLSSICGGRHRSNFQRKMAFD